MHERILQLNPKKLALESLLILISLGVSSANALIGGLIFGLGTLLIVKESV